MASFIKAAKFDPENPMILVGTSILAYGPNINDAGYSASPAAIEAIQKAIDFIRKMLLQLKKRLIQAMAVRYSNDSSIIERNIEC